MANILVQAEGKKLIINGRRCGYVDAFKETLFVTYTDVNGKKHYTVDGNEVTKDEGNNVYLELKKFGQKSFKVIPVTDNNAQELIDNYMSRYDEYTQYIDDYKQQREAEDRNFKICQCASVIKKALNIK